MAVHGGRVGALGPESDALANYGEILSRSGRVMSCLRSIRIAAVAEWVAPTDNDERAENSAQDC